MILAQLYSSSSGEISVALQGTDINTLWTLCLRMILSRIGCKDGCLLFLLEEELFSFLRQMTMTKQAVKGQLQVTYHGLTHSVNS